LIIAISKQFSLRMCQSRLPKAANPLQPSANKVSVYHV